MNKLKSITLTTGIFPPDIGGPASFIPIFAQKLVELGVKVEVITLSDEPHDDSHLPYKVIRINRKIKKPLRDLYVINAIVKSARTSDLIFSNTLAFESAIASKISGKKHIQKIVGDLAWERANTIGRFTGNLEEYQNASLDFKSKFTNLYRNFSVKQSDLIITPSYYLKNVVTGWNYPNDKIEVIYNAVEFAEADSIFPKSTFRIISVARLIPHKGIDKIIEALSNLSFEYEYIVIGDGPLKSSLEKLSQTLHVPTKFIGNISKKDVANWLSSSDLFILNSSYEGLPHIVLEAMENDCPVLASRVGGTPEIVKDGENGLLFNHNDTAEILEKICIIKNNILLKQKLIQHGKVFVKKFANVSEMVEKYIQTIERHL